MPLYPATTALVPTDFTFAPALTDPGAGASATVPDRAVPDDAGRRPFLAVLPPHLRRMFHFSRDLAAKWAAILLTDGGGTYTLPFGALVRPVRLGARCGRLLLFLSLAPFGFCNCNYVTKYRKSPFADFDFWSLKSTTTFPF